MVKQRDEYKKKKSHPPSSRSSDSHSEEGSLRINDYYQPMPRRTRRESLKNKIKVDLPYFYGKENVEVYLDWETKVEQRFACHHVSEKRKVSMATLIFQSNAIYWWTILERERRLHKDLPIAYWNDLTEALRRRHIPFYFNRELINKPQRL